MKIISGGQSGVDRAALDVAVARGLPYGGWCSRGGWAEDFPDPPGLLARYPHLRETPSADPTQRTEWNVRDSDAVLIVVDATGLTASRGTELAHDKAGADGKPCFIADLADANVVADVSDWLRRVQPEKLGIGGPRESEAPGIYQNAKLFLQRLFAQAP
jgi:putative molybdenum carrier protein